MGAIGLTHPIRLIQDCEVRIEGAIMADPTASDKMLSIQLGVSLSCVRQVRRYMRRDALLNVLPPADDSPEAVLARAAIVRGWDGKPAGTREPIVDLKEVCAGYVRHSRRVWRRLNRRPKP